MPHSSKDSGGGAFRPARSRGDGGFWTLRVPAVVAESPRKSRDGTWPHGDESLGDSGSNVKTEAIRGFSFRMMQQSVSQNGGAREQIAQ